MAYRPGFWRISQDFGISSTFDVSARNLTYQSGFCTAFHCSTKPGVFSSGTWESLQCFFSQPSSNKTILSIHDPCCHPGGGWPSSIVCKTRLTPCDAGLHPQGEERADRSDLPHRHIPDDISVFDVWHISTADMLFDISARNLSYQSSFGVSARILTYQPGIWRINKDPFRHLAYHLRNNGKRCGLIL